MPKIDLDAARARRREERGDDPVTFVIGGTEYPLPSEMPAGLLDGFGRATGGDLTGVVDGIKALVGDDTYAEMVDRHGLSFEDLEELLTQAADAYGMTTGESSASPTSSNGTGKPSRPTSSGSTGRTSGARSTGRATR